VLNDIIDANWRHTQFTESLWDLQDGHGQSRDSDAGDTARKLSKARALRRQAEEFAASRNVSHRDRRYWRGQTRRWTEQHDLLQQRWDQIGQLIVEQLTARLDTVDHDLNRLQFQRARREQWFREHPDVTQRLQHVERTSRSTTPNNNSAGSARSKDMISVWNSDLSHLWTGDTDRFADTTAPPACEMYRHVPGCIRCRRSGSQRPKRSASAGS
jgi:hypothetical protein